MHGPPSTVKAERMNRRKVRKERVRTNTAARALVDLSQLYEEAGPQQPDLDEPVESEITASHEHTSEIGTQTYLSGHIISGMEEELQRLRCLTADLQNEVLSTKIAEETFQGDDERVRLFTGLPSFVLLMAVFNFVSPLLQETRNSSLTKFQQLMLVLMRLRLNHSMQFLAVYFHVSRATASRYFLSVLNVLYVRMSHLVHWPDREDLRKTMPMEFRKYFGVKVAVIIDCFEVFIERPSNLMARAQTWSSYKHHNTVKFLIGITPQGIISYISKGYGGRCSDKFITGDCGFLEKLVPGDLVIADRGFDISEDVAL